MIRLVALLSLWVKYELLYLLFNGNTGKDVQKVDLMKEGQQRFHHHASITIIRCIINTGEFCVCKRTHKTG